MQKLRWLRPVYAERPRERRVDEHPKPRTEPKDWPQALNRPCAGSPPQAPKLEHDLAEGRDPTLLEEPGRNEA
jgi:hypothetical protein